MNCANCGTSFDSKFCPHCGQKRETKPLSFSSLWMDFQSRIYGLDGIFPRTVKDLLFRPGFVSKEFIRGNRVTYVGPVGYFFLMVALSVLLMQVTDFDFYEFSKNVTPLGGNQSELQVNISKLLSNFVSKNFKLFKFALIPLNTFWIWLFVRKKGYNFLECSVPSFYAQGQLELLFMINMMGRYIFDVYFNNIVFIIEPCYYGFLFVNWFSDHKIKFFIQGVVIWILSIVTYILLIAICGIIWIFSNPEVIHSIKS